ncbi:hypothetical protein CHUAL_003768 [Chamberlinius hualienensis]
MDDQKKNDKTIDALKSKVVSLEEELHSAGSIGKGLLEEIQNLKHKLNASNLKVDALNQENHNLKTENSLLENTNQYLRSELETYTELNNQKSCLLESEYDKIVSRYRQQIKDYEKELNDLKTVLNSRDELIGEMEKQTAILKTGQEENMSMKMSQLEQLLQDVQEMHSKSLEDKKQLQDELQMKDNVLDDFKDTIEERNQQIENLKIQLLEKDEQTASVYESLKFTKSELLEAQGELQIMRANVNQVDLDKRGNSLFSEVDDRRLKLESTCAKLKNKCHEFKNESQELKLNISKLQAKLASLLLASSRKVNCNLVEHLEKELTQANTEIKRLLANKDNKLANTECLSPSVESLGISHSASFEKAHDAEYRVLRLLLHESKNREVGLEKEIRDMWSERVTGREQRKEYRRKVIALEQESECQQSEIIKMKTIIEELQNDHKENKTSETAGDEVKELNLGSVDAVPNLTRENKPRTSRNTLKTKKVANNNCQQQ